MRQLQKADNQQTLLALELYVLLVRVCTGPSAYASAGSCYEASWSERIKTEQQALQAENEKKTRITQAEASKQEMQLAADAEAYAISKNAKARADAIKMEANALRNEPQLIQLRLAEKWDGALPKFTGGGDDSTMLLDIDSIMNAKSREVRKTLEHRQRSG